MKWIVGGVIAALFALIISLFFRLQAFKPVLLETQQVAEMKLIFKNHLGPYYKIVPTIEEVEKYVRANGETCELSFGEYLDDPDKEDQDRLRSLGGCLTAKTWENLPTDFLQKTIPPRFTLIAHFSGAPSIGPYKVYPKAADWMKENGYKQNAAILEVYKVINEKEVETTYYFPIEKIDEKK